MKGKLINFELWFIDSDERIQEDIDRANVYYALQDIKEAIEKEQIDTVVGLLFMDGFLHRDREPFYNVLKQIEQGSKELGIKKLYMIVGTCNGYQPELDKRNIDIEIIDWNFAANHAYYAYEPVWDQIQEWNVNAEKFMFPTGVPSRENRIGVIKSLYEKNLLHSKGIWSFFPPWTEEDKLWCRQFCSDYSDEQYKKFLNDCKNKIDYRYAEAKDYSKLNGRGLKEQNLFSSDLIETGGRIDPIIFKDSLITLVSEGPVDGSQYQFFTEKLWRTVINNQPFILIERPERIEYAKSLGLKTFENYTNYDPKKVNVAESLQYFFSTYKNNIKEIQKDILHNKNVVLNFYNKTSKLIRWLKEDLKIEQDDIDKYIRTSGSSVYVRFPKGV